MKQKLPSDGRKTKTKKAKQPKKTPVCVVILMYNNYTNV